jgi:DNA-binding PadR family transcriptional regulator
MSLTNALLGILARGPVHGYDLRQKFSAMLGGEWSISYGQLYPALSRLTRDGLISKTPEPGEKAAERNVYALTDAGRAQQVAWMKKAVECQVRTKDDLTLRMLSFDLIDEKAQRSILEKYRAAVADRLQSLRMTADGISGQWQAAILRRSMAACESELAWLQTVMT